MCASVSAVVVNWNLKETTCHALQSLEHLDLPCRLIVVDNGSDDGSVAYLASRFPQAVIISLPANVGFAAACNQAIRQALQAPDCDFVLLLNNDATLSPSALSELVRAAQRHPEAGIFGPKIYYQDPPRRIWYAGARRRRGVLAAADTGRGQMDQGQFSRERRVDYVFGAAMLMRRSVFDRIGLLDERYFLYLEDLDFCLRAQAAGFALWFVPEATAWHSVSASTAQQRYVRKYHQAKSTVYFHRKHTPPRYLLPVLAFWFLVFLRTLAQELPRREAASVSPYWRGMVAGVKEYWRA